MKSNDLQKYLLRKFQLISLLYSLHLLNFKLIFSSFSAQQLAVEREREMHLAQKAADAAAALTKMATEGQESDDITSPKPPIEELPVPLGPIKPPFWDSRPIVKTGALEPSVPKPQPQQISPPPNKPPVGDVPKPPQSQPPVVGPPPLIKVKNPPTSPEGGGHKMTPTLQPTPPTNTRTKPVPATPKIAPKARTIVIAAERKYSKPPRKK